MKKISFLAMVCFLLQACSEAPNHQFASADSYDDFIMNGIAQMQQSLFAVQKVTGSDSIHDDAELKMYAEQIDSVAKSIQHLPEYKGSKSYRDAALHLAGFYKKSVMGYYADISKIYREVKDSAVADDQVDAIISKLQVEETAADDSFVKARNAFAAQNHLDAIPPEPNQP